MMNLVGELAYQQKIAVRVSENAAKRAKNYLEEAIASIERGDYERALRTIANASESMASASGEKALADGLQRAVEAAACAETAEA